MNLPPTDPGSASRSARVGVGYGLAAYGFWGLVPIYFKAVGHVPAFEVLAHRVFWCALLMLLLMRRRGRLQDGFTALRSRRTRLMLLASTFFISLNWLFFIWSVVTDQILQASLGYYINPLVNVLLGYMFLGERQRRWQSVSITLAAVGVLVLTIGAGRPPWISLILAFSFGMYGLLRKLMDADAVVGLTVETSLLAPLAAGYLLVRQFGAGGSFGHVSPGTDLLLAAGGLVTALPLLWFANAARRLRLATLGFLQYLAPTGHFLLAVLVYGEAFTAAHMLSFACIWTALLIYSVDTARANKAAAAAPA